MGTSIPARGQAPSEVLILNSYHPGYAWGDGELRGLLETLQQDSPHMLPSIEYLDWKRQPTAEQEEIFIEMLKVRYGSLALRVVVTLDDKALELALKNRDLFGEAPIVFGGVNNYVPGSYGEAFSNVTGVAESKDFHRTLDLIRRLHPQLQEVVAYNDNTESTLAHRDAFEQAMAQFAPSLKYRFIENWTKDELLDALSRLPPSSIAFGLGATRDRDGVLLSDDLEFLKAVSERSSVPVYMISEPVVPLFSGADWNAGVWSGVGGSLVSSEKHGQQVGEIVLRVLAGECASDIPVITNSAGRLAVDWQQMKRFHLSFKALPEGTEVFNQPENFYRVHKTSILFGVIVFILLCGTVFVLTINIMLRRRAEHASTHLGAAVDQSEEIVIMLDSAGQVSYLNPAFSRITGWPEKTAKETSLACLDSPTGTVAFSEVLNKLRDSQSFSEQLECQHRGGETLQLLITGSVVRDVHEKPTGYILIARDVTREVCLEEQVRNAQKMKAVGVLAGGVAHDFNNVLQVIMGHTQLAMDPSITKDELDSSLAAVLASTKRGAQLSRQLLTFGRCQPLSIQNTNLNTLVAHYLKILQKLLGEHIDVQFSPDPNPGNVCTDHGQMEQVILNLCINARDAMSDIGRLTFRVENRDLDADFCGMHAWARAGQYVCLSVEDTGCGMTKETLDRIFEPFFTTKSIDKGTGLGLAVVYGIIEQHKGLIDVKSALGVGTTVSLYLPVCEPRAEDNDCESGATPNTSGSGTILLVEDETSVRDLCRRVLTHAGYHVLEAGDGEEAVSCFDKNADQIDLVLMDMVMPKLSGPAAGERIARIRPDVPILYASGYSQDWVDPKFSSGQTQVIQKPYEMTALLLRIDSALKKGSC